MWITLVLGPSILLRGHLLCSDTCLKVGCHGPRVRASHWFSGPASWRPRVNWPCAVVKIATWTDSLEHYSSSTHALTRARGGIRELLSARSAKLTRVYANTYSYYCALVLGYYTYSQLHGCYKHGCYRHGCYKMLRIIAGQRGEATAQEGTRKGPPRSRDGRTKGT